MAWAGIKKESVSPTGVGGSSGIGDAGAKSNGISGTLHAKAGSASKTIRRVNVQIRFFNSLEGATPFDNSLLSTHS